MDQSMPQTNCGPEATGRDPRHGNLEPMAKKQAILTRHRLAATFAVALEPVLQVLLADRIGAKRPDDAGKTVRQYPGSAIGRGPEPPD